MSLPREVCNVTEDKQRVMPIDPTKGSNFCESENCLYIHCMTVLCMQGMGKEHAMHHLHILL